METPRLFDVERMFWETLSRGASDFSALVSAHDAHDRAARVGVYTHAYVARLTEVLAEDYPRVAAALGVEGFSELAQRYVTRHPSRNPSVRYLGAKLPEFITSDPTFTPWLSDLARLEWARVEIFDAPDSSSVGVDDLVAVVAEEWPSMRFELIEACQLLHSEWPIAQLWSEANAVPDAIEPYPSSIRVWRAPDFQVRHAPMDARETAALQLVIDANNFSTVCESFADLPEDDAAREATSLLARWLTDGLIARFF